MCVCVFVKKMRNRVHTKIKTMSNIIADTTPLVKIDRIVMLLPINIAIGMKIPGLHGRRVDMNILLDKTSVCLFVYCKKIRLGESLTSDTSFGGILSL